MIDKPAGWIDDVSRKISQHSITFLQLGLPYSEARGELLAFAGGRTVQIDARKFLSEDVTADQGNPIYILGLEGVAGTRGERLGLLRERVMAQVESGRQVALISRVPKTAFPESLGSDIVHDAKQIFPPIECADVMGVEFPAHITECIRELGDRTIIALADAVWEGGLSPRDSLMNIDRVHQEALRGAGLVSTEGRDISWSAHVGFKVLRGAVATVSSETVAFTSAIPDTFTSMWTLERTVRNAVRLALVEKMGPGWRENCLEAHLRDEVVERAQKDSHPAATSVRDLRDPLEWLSTVELLELRETRELGDLGFASHMWSRLRTEIVPIRNRVAHMRMISGADALTVDKWRKIVVRALAG